MKHRTFIIIAIFLFIIGLVIGASALGVIQEIRAQLRPDFTVVIDGEVKEFKNADGEVVYPILYNGTTYLPLRAIGEIMGKKVYWYEDEKRIELKEEKTTVTDADVIVPDMGNVNNPAATANSNTANFIGKDKAEEIALKRAGLNASEVRFDRTELDEDRGVWHYDVEFQVGFTEYDAEINAVDGTIIKWEVDKD